ncbi:hypothetical protein EI77_04265 [Prosthecobacter fusiformis]|uniref:Uncharacterized protein n=1 Tax=Prosthecobacter fusiformis TaxID=48464 RepID=A0A4R7RJ44_9BACT|nr:hypothetical protein [Prosthecobacter fusiformis]TDU64081.1 hypothetical protein EI77_04265 [Prosthecobacter fusiformis]
MTTIHLTMEQLCALISAAQDGVLPRRTARQERNRRYYEACKRRKAAETAPSDAPHPDDVPAEIKTPPVIVQTCSVASQTLSDAATSEAAPSPSLPPSPPSPGPSSSAPTHTPPSAAARVPARKAATASRRKTALSAAGETRLKGRSGPRKETASDDAWLTALAESEAFRDVPVREEFERMRRWFTHRGLRCTRSGFLSWLQRYEPPLKLPAAGAVAGGSGLTKRNVADAAACFFAGTVADEIAVRGLTKDGGCGADEGVRAPL